MDKKLIVVRGGGDLATGTIYRLWSAGLPVLVLEDKKPAAIRRLVAVSEAVYDKKAVVEDMTAVLIDSAARVWPTIRQGLVPVLIDPEGDAIAKLKPFAVVDAIIAKRNLGTSRNMAPLTIALGPGFEAGRDVDYVIETKRGHNLGRIIKSGFAFPDTRIPGNIGGYTKERVIHAPEAGIFRNINKITDIVKAGDTIAEIETDDGLKVPVKTVISGIVRGLLRDCYRVPKGFKVADIDPRLSELENCSTISDKARCISGGVLELIAAAINKS